MVQIKVPKTKATLTAWPNPVTGDAFTVEAVELEQGELVQVELMSSLGEVVYSTQLYGNQKGELTHEIKLPKAYTKGFYTLKIRSKQETRSLKLLLN